MSQAPRRLSLGVMGHVDHGKTALVRALTGMETDRLPEEQRRGVSIALGFAHARFDAAEVDFIDMPGHERFVRTMIAGATGIGAVLLVVAANEGVKPQTVEHLQIAALLGLGQVLPVIAKADLATPAQAAESEAAALEQVRACGLTPAPGRLVSALTGQGMAELRRAIAALSAEAPEAPDDGFPWLPIDRAFSIAGRGTVVTGTLRRGVLREGAPLVLSPGGEVLRVRGLQVHGAPATEALPGQRVAVNLRGLEPSQAPRGAALTPPGLLTPASWIAVELRALLAAPPLKTGAQLSLLFGAGEVPVRVRLLDRDTLQPGETALAQLNTAEAVALPARERFVLRLPSPAATIAGGSVIEVAGRRLRRNDEAVMRRLRRLSDATPGEIVTLRLDEAGAGGITPAELAGLAGLSPERVEGLLAPGSIQRLGGGRIALRSAITALETAVMATLQAQAESQPNGLARRRLATLMPQTSPDALDAAVATLAAAGRVTADGGGVRLAPRRADRDAAAKREAELAIELSRRLLAGGLAPPDLASLTPTPLARRALDRLLREGEAVRTVDQVQKRELVFHRDAVAAARAKLEPQLAAPGLTLGEAGAVLGVTRKFSVPLMEYLDAVRFTRRQGDRRVLGPAAFD